jgi:hypothetical protein
VKNCHGVLAAHSSPMYSIGVNGAVSISVAPTRSIRGDTDAESRSPAARLPIWSWFCRYATNRCPGMRARSTARPCTRPRKLDHVPAWKNAPVSTVARQSSEPKSE